MSSKTITKEELIAIFMAGGRNSGEKSRALPKQAYLPPGDTFEFPTEKLRREEAKRVARAKKRRK